MTKLPIATTLTIAITTPTSSAERIQIVDVLRGFALFGILCINIVAFANPGSPPGFGFRGAWWDVVFFGGIVTLVESKFFTLFSSLFGLGFALQLFGAQKRGENLIPRFRRRLLALGVFGVCHIVFLWEGDILFLYALVGFMLIGFRNFAPERLLVWIRWLLAVPLTLYTLILLGLLVAQFVPGTEKVLQDANREFGNALISQTALEAQKYSSGEYGSLLLERVKAYSSSFILLLTRIPTVLAMFLLGLYVGQIDLLKRPNDHLELLRNVRFWGWLLGLPLSLLIAVGYLFSPPILAIVLLIFNQAIAGVLLSMAYASSLVLQLARGGTGFATLVAKVGQMGLSNYLGQSLMCSLIFSGYGLGLAGKLAPWSVFGLAIMIYGLQILVSNLWMRWFKFGPMESLWRSITYLKWQPLR